MKTNRVISMLLSIVIVLGAVGCRPQKTSSDSSRPAAIEPSVSSALPPVGEKLSGFVVSALGEIEQLGAMTVELVHAQSGATVLFIQNDDQNRRFSISYRTPVIDEADTNHIFEHAILMSSEKYPSSNLFFDLASKTYNTYINAATYPTFTTYPVSSQSEEQLIKMMDAYLSCMVSPEILRDENVFAREALRYELESSTAPITLTGTVFSEDMGYLPNLDSNNYDAVKDALYPGMTASNSIGMLFREYQQLTYERLIETYERCYAFDNSLILLYGDLDYRRILSMLDKEYLAKADRKSADLSQYYSEQVAPGHTTTTVKSPAYQGDTERAIISYAIDLSEESAEEQIYWGLFARLFSDDNAFWKQELTREKITNLAYAKMEDFELKPHLVFSLANAEADQRDDFRMSIERALHDVAKNGFAPELVSSMEKAQLLSDRLARENDQIEDLVGPMIIKHWVLTGKTDYYTTYTSGLAKILADEDQLIFKRLAAKALSPKRSALVTTVATPGLAEEVEQEQEAYLLEKKAGMTPAQIDAMVLETKQFAQWNQVKKSCESLAISAQQLPDPIEPPAVTTTDLGGITSHTVSADTKGVGAYGIALDLGALPQEQLDDLQVFLLLAGDLATKKHSAEQVRRLCSDYLYMLSAEHIYPSQSAGENSRPMLLLSWNSLTEDYEKSLSLLIEILGSTDFSDTAEMIRVLEEALPAYDLSRSNNSFGVARRAVRGALSQNAAFSNMVDGQGRYYHVKATLEAMKESPERAKEISLLLGEIGKKLLNRDRLITMTVAPTESIPDAEKTISKLLTKLPAHKVPPASYSLPTAVQRLGIPIEASSQGSVMGYSFADLPEWQGRYLPFLYAASDRYLIPRLRFEMGAYSAGLSYNLKENYVFVYSHSDPNVGATHDVFEGLPAFLKQDEIEQENFDGYLLNAYSKMTPVEGVLSRGTSAINEMIYGYDLEQTAKMVADIKNATLSDQATAAALLEQAMKRPFVATSGNEQRIRAEAERFDAIEDYRSAQAETQKAP